MMVIKKFRMRRLTLSGTVTAFEAVLLLGFTFVLLHGCTGVNHCTGHNHFSVLQGDYITLTCNISAGPRMFWFRYLGEKLQRIGFCTLSKNECTITNNKTNYTLTSSGRLFSELTIPGNIGLSELDMGCSGPYNKTTKEYKEKQKCSIRVVYPPDPPYFNLDQDGVIRVTDTELSTLHCYSGEGKQSFQEYQTDFLHVSCEGVEKGFGSDTSVGHGKLFPFTGDFSGHNGTTCTCLETSSRAGYSFNRTATVTVLVETPATTTTTVASATSDVLSKAALSSKGPATTSSGPAQEGENDEKKNADSSPPIMIIVVCTVGVLVLLLIVVVVIIVVRRRRDAQKRYNQNVEREVDVVVEHINDMYVAAEDLHDPRHPNPSPSDAARVPTNQNTAASSLQPAAATAAAAAALNIDEESSGGYSTVSLTQPAPPASLVGAPRSEGNATGLHSTADGDDGRLVLEASDTQAGGEYAVVKKPRPTFKKSAQSGDVYSQVQKKSKRGAALSHAQPDTEAEVCNAQDRKPKSSAAPRKSGDDTADSDTSSASAKPVLTVTQEERRGSATKNASSPDHQARSPLEGVPQAEHDDFYKALNFHRTPAPQSATDSEAVYSHLADLTGSK